jgi:hypothetical protein
MNERIRELAIEATLIIAEPNGFDPTRLSMSQQKFAQLIVAECSKVIVNGGYRNPALGEKHPLTPPEIATMIKEHFGVEL